MFRKERKMKKRNLNKIISGIILVAMLVWGLAYKVYHLLEDNQLNLPMLWYSFKRLLFFDQEFHFYYMHMILLVYVFLPITRLFAEKADKKLLEYALVLWLVLAVVYPTLRMFPPFSRLSGIPVQWAINLTFASIGYGLLGYYLKRYPLSLAKSAIFFVLGFLVTFGMTFFFSEQNNKLYDLFLQGNSIGVCLLAVGIFSLSSFVKLGTVSKKAVTHLSKASFCIYLSHMFVLYLLIRAGITASLFAPILSVPLIASVILCISFAIYFVISKIPILNKWII